MGCQLLLCDVDGHSNYTTNFDALKSLRRAYQEKDDVPYLFPRPCLAADCPRISA